jgi:anthranilate/para-aminobenzoate synthase component I
MEVIAELEPSRRGVYCGSMGYWSVTGELDTSVAIRTAVVAGGARWTLSSEIHRHSSRHPGRPKVRCRLRSGRSRRTLGA